MKKFVNSQSFFQLRVKNLRQVCKNCNFHYQRNIFSENFFWNTLWVRRFCSSFGWKLLSRFVKAAVYFSHRNIVGERQKVIFWKKTFLLMFFFGLRRKSDRRGCQIPFQFSTRTVCAKTFVRKKFNNAELFSGFGWRIFGRFVKTAFYKFRGTFMKNTFVWKKLKVQRFSSGFGRKVLGRIVNSTLFFSTGTFWGKFFSLKKVISSWIFCGSG